MVWICFLIGLLEISATVRKQGFFSDIHFYPNSAGHFHSIIDGWGRNKGGKVFDLDVHTCSSKYYVPVMWTGILALLLSWECFCHFSLWVVLTELFFSYFKKAAKVSVVRVRRQQEFSARRRWVADTWWQLVDVSSFFFFFFFFF